jgi:hypothetical protein
MKTVVIALMILTACPAFARQDPMQAGAQEVAFFDVLDLPARVDEPKLERTDGKYVLKCALANRTGESIVGLRLTLLTVNTVGGRVSRLTWNEATSVPAYSIVSFEFHPPIKTEMKDTQVFLGIDEVSGRDSIWRTVDSDKMLRAYARGQHGLIPKVQRLQNTVDGPNRVIIGNRIAPKPPKP